MVILVSPDFEILLDQFICFGFDLSAFMKINVGKNIHQDLIDVTKYFVITWLIELHINHLSPFSKKYINFD
jgi:hypothetical protein